MTVKTIKTQAELDAGPRVAVHLHSAAATITGGVVIDVTDVDETTAAGWCEHHGVEVTDGRAVLYKATDKNLQAGHAYMAVTTYTPGAELVAEDWRDDNECGGGFHLSPTAGQALTYRNSEDGSRFLRCTAALEDLRPISSDKCKVRALRVEAEVDHVEREIQPLAAAATT